MNQSNYWISLDINKIHSQLTLSLKQGETGRKIHISLTEDGRPYQIDEKCYAWLQARKNDSDSPMSHSCTIENNKVVYCVQADTTSTTGRIECEIVLSSEDGQVIISASFTINVYNTVFTEIEEDNKTEINALSALIAEANTLIASVEDKLDKGEFDAGFADEMKVTTTTGEAGTEASVSVTPVETSSNKEKKFNFEFTIPKGDKGDKGDQGEQGIQGIQGEKGDVPTVSIGKVTTGKPNTEAKVTNSGSNGNAVLNFTLPIGEQAVRFITKEEAKTLVPEEGIIYILKDDTTLDEINEAIENKYNYSEAQDFSDLDKLYAAPQGCYVSSKVYGLAGTYTLYIAGEATSYNQVSSGKHKTIMAVHRNTAEAYIASVGTTGSGIQFGWSRLHYPPNAVHAETADTAESASYIKSEWEEFSTNAKFAANAVYLVKATPERGEDITFLGHTDENAVLRAEYNDMHLTSDEDHSLKIYFDSYYINTSANTKVGGKSYMVKSSNPPKDGVEQLLAHSASIARTSTSDCTLTNIRIKRITT